MRVLPGLVVAVVAGCASSTAPVDVALEGLALSKVEPNTAIPGTEIHIEGDSFVDNAWGESVLRLRGTADGVDVDVELAARFVDYDNMLATVDLALLTRLGGNVDFDGEATLEVLSAVDGELYTSNALPVSIRFRRDLTPTLTIIPDTATLYVNDLVAISGDGFLLGGAEGTTVARISGCFTPEGQGVCNDIPLVEVTVQPTSPYQRTSAHFAFKPSIAGIEPGVFTGEIEIENRHLSGEELAAPPVSVSYQLLPTEVMQISPTSVSLGQYVFIEGGGFVGGEPGAFTEINLVGTFTPTGSSVGVPVDILLIPDFVEGRMVRYVLSQDDANNWGPPPGIDLRMVTGTFDGTVAATTTYGAQSVTGAATPFTLTIAPVKQVVFFDFRPTYVEALRLFGLRAVDFEIRQRIHDVVSAAYRDINIEFRTEPPTDFAAFSHVEITGTDPNGQGLFGYDNTPGKDNGNLRLHDRLGGVNAQTQEDNYPGYGGVFVESLMAFSMHPAIGDSVPGSDETFDRIFDQFRPDQGSIIVGADLSGFTPLASGDGCPADDREGQIGCAVWTMGSLIGTTLAHEIGHSLGLANPFLDGFHNPSDAPNRLMDGGGDRSFLERAVLGGEGPAVFCDEEYTYLRGILPTDAPMDPSVRPDCY